MSFNRFYVISPLALVALSACRSPYEAAVTGVISKGPLSNALVFLDLDGDNVLDSNEQSARTDANGNFSINSAASGYKIVALTDDSTVDASSGATLSGIMLTAPQGAAVVSPRPRLRPKQTCGKTICPGASVEEYFCTGCEPVTGSKGSDFELLGIRTSRDSKSPGRV